jgi:hypothetical protein
MAYVSARIIVAASQTCYRLAGRRARWRCCSVSPGSGSLNSAAQQIGVSQQAVSVRIYVHAPATYEATLTAAGDQTTLVFDERGMPLDLPAV